jgi:hypothetical protein
MVSTPLSDQDTQPRERARNAPYTNSLVSTARGQPVWVLWVPVDRVHGPLANLKLLGTCFLISYIPDLLR